MRLDVAKELTYTARVVSGAEAAELGLVTRVADDPLAAAQELAAEIAGRSPDAVRAAKQLYDESWNGPVDEALMLETDLQRRAARLAEPDGRGAGGHDEAARASSPTPSPPPRPGPRAV